VDLENKSPEFIELYAKSNPIPNARAKVPLLQVGDDKFFCESMVVAEFIAEAYAESSQLLPKRAEDRAVMRLFIELCGSTFSYFPLLRAEEDKDFDSALKTLKEGLVNTDAFLKHSHPDGPFLLGDKFTLAECTVAPFVQRCCTILPAFTGKSKSSRKPVDPLDLCDELGLIRLRKWIEAVNSRPSVKASEVSTNGMIESTTRMLERFAAMKK